MARTSSIKLGSDPTLPDVQLEIGGKVRQLCYDFAAIVKAEQLTGINLMKAARFQDLSFSEVRGLLFAALLRDDPKLSLDQLDRECGPQMMRSQIIIQNAIAEAFYGSLPEPQADATGEAQAQATNEA